MPPRKQQARSVKLLNSIGNASADVIAARMLAFSNPATLMSPWHQAEAHRMTSEKLTAGSDGMLAAGTELAKLPGRMLQLAARPSTWTPTGWMHAWTEGAGLWFGVGNAALAPAKSAVSRNRTRLAKRSGR